MMTVISDSFCLSYLSYSENGIGETIHDFQQCTDMITIIL